MSKQAKSIEYKLGDIPLRGTIPIMILCILADGKPHYIAGLAREIDQICGIENFASRRSLSDALNSLYRADDVDVDSYSGVPQRTYYIITQSGRQTVKRRLKQFEQLRSAMSQIAKYYKTHGA